MNPLTRRDIILLAIGGGVLRALFHITYTPIWAGDSIGYSSKWKLLISRWWQDDDGLRLPGYPIFLGFAQWLAGSPPQMRLTYASAEIAVWLQQLAGVGAVILLYLVFQSLGVSRRVAFWGAMVFALQAGVCLFEMYLLPLALTSYLLIAALWLFTSSVSRAVNGQSSYIHAVGSGLTFSIAALTRAEVAVFLAVLISVWAVVSLLYRRRVEFTALRPALLTVTASALPLLVGWMSYNAINLGQFTLTTATSYNATSTVYNLFDRVEKEDRVFGQIMVKYYRGPTRIDFINDASPELLAHASEMPLEHRRPWSRNADLFAYAGQVSRRLQWRYPRTYLSNAAQSFGRTFNFIPESVPLQHVSDPESPDGDTVVKKQLGYNLTEWLRRIEAPVIFVFYCLTLLFIPAAVIANKMGRCHDTVNNAAVFAVALSTAATLAAFGFAHTYFQHYGICYFGTIVLCGVVACDAIISWLRFRKMPPAY